MPPIFFRNAFKTLFTVGNEVNILEKHDDGWWKAEIRGCTGLIPETYVEEIS